MTKNYMLKQPPHTTEKKLYKTIWTKWVLSIVLLMGIQPFHFSQSTIVADPANNNGSSAVCFNFVNNNTYDIIITDVASVTGTTGANSATLWYKAGAISGPPGAISTANGWTATASQAFTGTANTTTTTAQPMMTGLSVVIPASQTYAMCFSLNASLRYSTLTAGTYTYSAGGCSIVTGTNQGYGGTLASPTNTPRGFIGTITFIASTPCVAPPTAGTITASANPVCPNVNSILTLSGGTGGMGQSYQWLSSPNSNGPWNPISGATNASYQANQTSDTYYRCAVSCSGQSDTTVPYLLQTNSFLNCYCTSNATSTLDEDIIGVHVAGLSNTSTCTTTGGPGSISQQYSNYTNLPPTALARSVTYPFTVDIGTCGTGNFNNMLKVFIDFNQNGLFTDAGEEVYVSPSATLGAHSETFNLLIPLNAALGVTRMRIVNVETTIAGNITPCGTYSWGETEDYFVEIYPVPTCPQPTALTVLATTTSSVSLDWTAGGTETMWQLRYGPMGFNVNNTGTSVIVSTASDTILGGLAAYGFYDVYVRAICGPGDTSLWSPKKTFNTYGLGQFMEMELVCDTAGFFDISGMFNANALATDGEAGFMLPWPFYFQGAEVNQVTIGNNGAIVFNTITAQISPTNANTLATTAAIGLYPFWDDLDDNTAAIYWGSVGNAPNRRFIIQWNAKHDLFLSGTPFVFQIILEESTGKIYYQYNNRVTGSTTYDYGASATIGIAGTSQDFALSFNNNTWLTNNECAHFYYTNCPKPVNLIYNYITTEEAGIDWGAGLFGEAQWTVIYGPTGFDPTTGGTVQTYFTSDAVLNNLTQLTTYDVYIYANCSPGNSSFALMGTFTTLPYCSNPTGFTATNSIDTLFTNWNWAPSAPQYQSTAFEVRYDFPGYDPNMSGSIDLSDNIPGDTTPDPLLFAGGVYEVYLRAVCDTLVSGFVGPILVTMPRTNNDVCGAELIPVDGVTRIFSNAGATTEPNEQTIAPPVTGNQTTTGWGNNTMTFTTWHKFIAPSSGEMRINSTDRTFNGQMAVYQVVSCSDFTSFSLLAANDDAIEGGSLAPNFTICGLTPGAEYFLVYDSYSTTATGQYAINLSAINLEAGNTGQLIQICYGDTVNLFSGINGYQYGGVWNDIDQTFRIVNDSLFRTNGLAIGTYQFEYQITDGCASDEVLGNYQIFPRSSAGNDGTLEVCKHAPVDVLAGLTGVIQSGGQWYNAMGTPIGNSFVGVGVLNVAGTFNYTYIVGNNVCPDDTAYVSVTVNSGCDFLGVSEEDNWKVSLFPNPSPGQVTASFGTLLTNVKLNIIDLNGRIIEEFTAQQTDTVVLNLSYLEKGTYLVKLESDQYHFMEKLVLQ